MKRFILWTLGIVALGVFAVVAWYAAVILTMIGGD